MHQKLLTLSILVLAACGRNATPTPGATDKDPAPINTPLAPTSTTAIMFNGSFTGGAELRTLDLASREQRVILKAPAIGSDSIVRVFGKTLYIVARDYTGQNNTLTVLDPEQGYALACPTCEWPLGEGTNVQDFWAVSATKAYFTILPDKTFADFAHRNEVIVINPLTGAIDKRIDVGAAVATLGDTLATDDPDGGYELGAMFSDGAHLFVAMSALNNYQLIPKASEKCGVVPGRVAVIDLTTDTVVKIIVLSGANPAPSPSRFIPQPDTNYLLLSTPGSLGDSAIDGCGGIERIDQSSLTLATPYASEVLLGGSVLSFDIDAEGDGVVFLLTAGDFQSPTYEVRRFRQGTAPLSPALSAPGAKGFTQPSFVKVSDHGTAFVGLPLRDGPAVASFLLSTGASDGDPIGLDLPPIDVAFYPGVPFAR